MERYCPNCSAPLREPGVDCWNCGAIFGPGSSWTPTAEPAGLFEERAKPPNAGNTGISKADAHGGAAWKITLLAVVFIATFVPYVVAAFLANPLDLISFVVAWVLFFVLRA